MKNNFRQKTGVIQPGFREKIDDFLFSDSVSVTATKFLLMFVAVGGVAVVGAAIPGLMKAMDIFRRHGHVRKKMKSEYSKRKLTNAFAYLKKKQLITILKGSDGKVLVSLTNKGKKRLAKYSLDMMEIKKPVKWDGKWRVLMFDIPAHPKAYNSAREALRNKIKKLGFYQMQKSVWIHPYECEDELLFIAEMFHIQRYVEVLTVEKLLHEEVVKKQFPPL